MVEFIKKAPSGVYSSSDEIKPDVFSFQKGKHSPPDSDFIISRDINGNVLSRYSDDFFDLVTYKTTENGKHIIPITDVGSISYQEDARWLWFLCYRFGIGRNGNNLSVSTLYNRFIHFVKPLCLHANNNNISVQNILESEQKLSCFILSHQRSHSFCTTLNSVLKSYNSLGEDICGFKVAWTKKISSHLKQINISHESNIEQTPIIPPRLYQSFLKQSWGCISEFEQYSEGIKNFLIELINEPPSPKTGKAHKQRKESLAKWISSYNLTNIAVSRGWKTNRAHFFKYLSNIMLLCKGLIHLYSGMRDNEVTSLHFNCLQLDKVNNRKHARLLGNTTKYVGNKKQVKWVTTSELERVISVLHVIGQPIAELLNLSTNLMYKKNEIPSKLFLSTAYIKRQSFRQKHPQGKAPNWKYSSLADNDLFDMKPLTVTENDLQYLEKFDHQRDWRKSEYAVGNIWPYRTHQFRRSLAVYSAQSGLVTIGSLQSQLKHLCQEVTFYYRNNAEFASEIFDVSDDEHMAKQYQRDKPIADFTAYALDILFSEEKLHGAGGRSIERTIKANTEAKRQQILNDRVNTIKKFKNGQIAYTETPLGGCLSVQTCDKRLLGNLTACVKCDDACIKESKVESTIESMTIFVDSLPKNSIEYRTESSELEQLIKLKKSIKG